MAKKTAKGHRGPGARRRPKRDNAGASTRQTSKGQGPRRESRDSAQGHPRFRNATFALGAAALPQMPPDSGREVALGGRSNAGKSSALNALTGHGGLARVSKTPGRTQQINFFTLGSEEARLVDLPGYGFARAPVRVKQAWSNLVEGYLRRRVSLAGVVVVMDSRRPFMDTDVTLVNWACAVNVACHVVLTKSDKLSRNQGAGALAAARRELAKFTGDAPRSVQLFSALNREGVAELGDVLAGLLWPVQPEPPEVSPESQGPVD